ncbi:MAG TPA: archease [Candidatus Acidoferrales bacterium]|nr:archease [Candidatus Acidoferrales bacterium]
MSEKKYQVSKHASDLTMRIVGKTEADLLTNSAFALFDLMTDLDKVRALEPLPIEAEGVDQDDLIVNWMRELLYVFQVGGYLLKECKIQEVRDNYVRAEVRGEKYNPDAHEIRQELQSVLYEQCRMEKTGSQWTARVTFEI